MILNISNNGLTVIERGVYYFGLSDYPNITPLEWNKIIAFIKYEKLYGRQTKILYENENILAVVNNDKAIRLLNTG